ncbi:hypothetical protein KSP39_PZI007338 [Platanthera zijinensis]|uniref:PCI domain-containing protein n=1 Tax=Platanthera zijinensis TaxID=2320716 RepID=A0AAP0BPN6_9ASPA
MLATQITHKDFVFTAMSFSGFGRTSGPSIPPTTLKTFVSAPEFPWSHPNSSSSSSTTSALFPQVQEHQLSGPRPEVHLRNAIDEAPNMMRAPMNFESSSLVQNIFSDKEVQHDIFFPFMPDSSPNRMAGLRMSPSHGDSFSQNMLDHADSRKRARSPFISAEKPLYLSSPLLDYEREMQAKAKRFVRFNSELMHPLNDLDALSRHKTSGKTFVQQKSDGNPGDESHGGSFDHEGSESLKAVIGLCPNMCPDLERDERERKGDLDKYERLNGDRNQTNKFLAVKKYNRMAECEAELIRPMPVLQKTVDYLLSLLDQPYDGNFINIYNFLWDRMRAVRMDLRMQHIFNEDAILMLEQMIRLHIIAMHELCEFKKGEGFTEGFDAHLNIEQMNKTSVELFQLYDDHRKFGKNIASEKEFRGYYALFKLDKHPGYKVEPAELSLDLAKMTPEIRSTPEILFARVVARACRIGNYIGFFRLARKSTYLQACLMHAHFSKLRKQALASLHSGLQNNQGIPISHVDKWLAMEGEDVDSLLEYHGFSIKRYEETYMVKEGPFLNSDMDFPTKCAQLVQRKRSKRIVDDARSASVLEVLSVDMEITDNNIDMLDHRDSIDTGAHMSTYVGLILDSEVSPTSMVLTEPVSLPKERLLVIQNRECGGMTMAEMPVRMTPFMPPVEDVDDYTQKDDSEQILHHYNEFSINVATLKVYENNKSQPAAIHPSSSYATYENSTPKKCENEKVEIKSVLPLFDQKEAKKEMLKLMLRKWKKHSAMRRENRELKELLASAALSSLTVGLPIGQIGSRKTRSSENIDFDAIARARFEKYSISWLKLNVSDLVAPIMFAKDPNAKFICWKFILLVQPIDPTNQTYQLALDWLCLKLMGANRLQDEELVVSSSDLSIWKKWTDPYGSSPQSCCLSVIRKKVLDDTKQIDEGHVLQGAGCLIYLVSETIPWETQRTRLQNFCASIADGANLPLLILNIDSPKGEVAELSLDIIRRLAPHDKYKRKICSSSVTFLSRLEKFNSFFDDPQLRAGLQWLANHTPSVPSVCIVRTRELVLKYLKRFHKGLEMTPDDCITVFNEALEKSAEEIMVTASMNPTQWPAPEIDLLDKSCKERILASMCVPSKGWSSYTRIDPIVRGINSCKLPCFPDTSWLKHGSFVGQQIWQQKLALEKLLIAYLNESSKLLKPDLASREASIMLQKYAGLHLHGSSYCLAPKWILIFKRIFSWQLNKLVLPGISNTYILDCDYDDILDSDAAQVNHGYASKDLPSSSFLEEHPSVQFSPAEVSLDELIKISCYNPFKKRPLRTIGEVPEANVAAVDDTIVPEAGMTSQHLEDPGCRSFNDLVPELINSNGQIIEVSKSDRLTTLLERCNKLQDMIDQKLSIYF